MTFINRISCVIFYFNDTNTDHQIQYHLYSLKSLKNIININSNQNYIALKHNKDYVNIFYILVVIKTT